MARPNRDTLEMALKRRMEWITHLLLGWCLRGLLAFSLGGQLVPDVKVVRTYHYPCGTSFDGMWMRVQDVNSEDQLCRNSRLTWGVSLKAHVRVANGTAVYFTSLL